MTGCIAASAKALPQLRIRGVKAKQKNAATPGIFLRNQLANALPVLACQGRQLPPVRFDPKPVKMSQHRIIMPLISYRPMLWLNHLQQQLMARLLTGLPHL
jgi:hypothetical protein